MSAASLRAIAREVKACRSCYRLVGYLGECRERYPDYWAKPVPGFGDPAARLVVAGLAPGYHGANRSGRPFWLDASGIWLYGELEKRGLWDGKSLRGVYIANAVKCVPPGNRPSADEQATCRPFLVRELAALSRARLVLALGSIAQRAVLTSWNARPFARHPFGHGALHRIAGRPPLLCSYHPSRQNTNTGVLTRAMWSGVFDRAEQLAFR